jgi:hypothetical protein
MADTDTKDTRRSTNRDVNTAADQHSGDLSWSQIAWDYAKVASNFVPGPWGRAASAAIYAANDIDPNAPLDVEIGQAAMGAAKGLAMHTLVNALPGLNPVVGGMSVALGSRVADTTLSYNSYFDKDGNFSSSIMNERYSQLANPQALAIDAGIGLTAFGASKAMGAALGKLQPMAADTLMGRALQSPLTQRFAVGGVAGMGVYGANETVRETRAGEGLQPLKIGEHALAGGLILGSAASTGGYIGARLPSETSTAASAPETGAAVKGTSGAASALDNVAAAQHANAIPLYARSAGDAPAPAPASVGDAPAQAPANVAASVPAEPLRSTDGSTTKAPSSGALEARILPGSISYSGALRTERPLEFTVRDISVPRLRENFSPDAFKDFSTFVSQAIDFTRTPGRVYTMPDAPTKILVPETHATRYDATLPFGTRSELNQSGVNYPIKWTTPEHAAFAVKRTPDGGASMNRIYLLDGANPIDVFWRDRFGEPLFKSSAATDSNGTMWLFDSQWSSRTLNAVNHEWAHNFEANHPELAARHEQAVRLENGVTSDPHAERPGERLPVHLEEVMAHHPDLTVLAGMDRPIETTVLGRSLEHVIQNTKTPGTINDGLLDRTNYIRAAVEPTAREQLQIMTRSSNADTAGSATDLLRWLDATARTD